MKATGDWTIDMLFEGRPEARRLFEGIRAAIESIGPVTVETMKTQVSFASTRKFAWVWLPQIWVKKRPDDSVTLTFDLNHQISDQRIVQAVEPSPGHWTHHVLINDESDIDESVLNWLRQAYVKGLRPEV